jgi:glycosyltransferase involved in cell wall biosynthesis
VNETAVAAVLVVIPTHDEEQLLPDCLEAMSVAVDTAADRAIRCLVQVVLDDCTDGSAAIANEYPFAVMFIEAGMVGVARSAGVEAGLAQLADLPPSRVWIANTDADSRVPANWITAQVAAADEGADVFLGTVKPDFGDLSPAYRRNWLRTHPAGVANGNTHGANLGVRASAYRAAGGFANVAEHEDVMLVDGCRRTGAAVEASTAAEVLTSGRTVGRTPGGYAAFVRRQAEDLERSAGLRSRYARRAAG